MASPEILASVTNRRHFLRCASGALALCACPRLLAAQTPPGVRSLSDRLSVIDARGANLVVSVTGDGLVLVDSGPVGATGPVATFLDEAASAARGVTLFNTHYHLDQTGNNESFGQSGARIIAHDRTRQWMSTDYWVPDEERYAEARPAAARPTETFQTTGTLETGPERIDYGHLPLAHTAGDIYVFFRTSNVVAAGDVVSPMRDPALDYFTGAWIGGRVDAMDILLALGDGQTRFVPSYGPVMTRAQLQAERDMMEEVRAHLFTQVREGKGPEDMLDGGLLDGLGRTWNDPHKFLYDAAKGMWAHHNKLDHNVV